MKDYSGYRIHAYKDDKTFVEKVKVIKVENPIERSGCYAVHPRNSETIYVGLYKPIIQYSQ